jgi:hypothetical protein
MNEREFLTAVINGTITADVIAHATEGIAKLDARNEKRKATQTKVQKENEPIQQAILKVLANGAKLSKEMTDAVNAELATAYSDAKVRGSALNLAKKGLVVTSKVKVKGQGEKTLYALAPTPTEEVEGTDEVEVTATDEVAEG